MELGEENDAQRTCSLTELFVSQVIDQNFEDVLTYNKLILLQLLVLPEVEEVEYLGVLLCR